MDQPSSPRPFAFVVMPFAPELDALFVLIRTAAEEAGVYAERVDGSVYDGPIIERIHNQIAKADVVIAVVTGQNANVMYEVGYAAALNKLIVPGGAESRFPST